MRAPRSGVAEWAVRLAAALVPADRRKTFLRQWEADLAYRIVRTPGRPTRHLLWALGAFRHALEIRRLHRRPSWGVGVDVRHGCRALARRPALAAVAVGIFGVGIGTATAVYSVVDAVVLRPFPFDDPESLVAIDMSNPVLGMDQVSVTWPDAMDWLAAGPLASGSAWRTESLDLADEAEPRRLEAVAHGPGFFETLRARAVVGRVLGDADQAPEGAAVVVLSERLWEHRYGRDPAVVGRTVRLDGEPHTVVGVVADDHRWPRQADAWTPLRWGGAVPEYADSRDNFTWSMIARLRPGRTPAEASGILSEVVARSRADAEEASTRAWRPRVATLHGAQVGAEALPVSAILGSAVLALILIASFNVAGLLLVRATERTRDLSLRAALGAGKARLFRQLLIESLLLAGAGGVAGIGLGFVLVRLASGRVPEVGDRLAGVQLHGGVLAVGLGVTVFAALVGGLAPALRGARAEVADALREGTAGASASRRRRRAQRALVVAELALGTVLLLGAGLTHRAFRAALDTDPGFDADGLLVFSVRLPATRYAGGAEIGGFLDRVVRELEGAPGVDGVSSTSVLPLGVGGSRLRRAFLLDGEPDPPESVPYRADWVEVDPAWFRTLDVTPVRGRVFDEGDGAESTPVAVVNEAFARVLPDDDSRLLGRTLRSVYDENLPREVVGIVPTIRMNDTDLEDRPAILVPRSQSPRRTMAFLVRTSGEPAEVIPVVRDRIAELDPDVALDGLASLRARHETAVAGVRLVTGVFTLFGAAALILGTIGIYSLVSFTLAGQVREIGIRMAVGASRGRIRARVMAEGLAITGLGLAFGAALGGLFTRILASLIPGPSWLDPVLWATVPVVLGTATLLATAVPAMRATRIDPARALGAD